MKEAEVCAVIANETGPPSPSPVRAALRGKDSECPKEQSTASQQPLTWRDAPQTSQRTCYRPCPTLRPGACVGSAELTV